MQAAKKRTKLEQPNDRFLTSGVADVLLKDADRGDVTSFLIRRSNRPRGSPGVMHQASLGKRLSNNRRYRLI